MLILLHIYGKNNNNNKKWRKRRRKKQENNNSPLCHLAWQTHLTACLDTEVSVIGVLVYNIYACIRFLLGLWLVTIHQHSYFDSTGISGTENTGLKFSEVLNQQSYHDLERSNPIFSQDTPAYDAASPN